MPFPDTLYDLLAQPYRGLCGEQVPGVGNDAAVPHLQVAVPKVDMSDD